MYIEAVFKTLVLMAGMLFLVALAWDHRPGFSSLGCFSRYLAALRVLAAAIDERG